MLKLLKTAIFSGCSLSGKLAIRHYSTARSSTKTSNYVPLLVSILSVSSIGYLTASSIQNDTKGSRKIIIIEDNNDDDEDEEEEEDLEDKLQRERQERIKNKPPLSQIFNISDFEYVAKQVLPERSWAYYETGSDDEFSIRENHYAFGRIFFRPKCLVDVTNATTEVNDLFGSPYDAPFYCTAFAGSSMADKHAEKNLLYATGKEKIPYLIPLGCSYPLDEFMDLEPSQMNFHQIHFFNKDTFDKADKYIKNIEDNHPNIKALFINVDLPCIGNREKNLKIRATLDNLKDDGLEMYSRRAYDFYNLTWEDMDKLNKMTKLPIVLKGVLRKEDVLKASQIGLAGCLLSNHGGRQLDFSMPPIEILHQSRQLLRANGVKDEDFKMFIDGGVRRGSDIIKALCLGADAVGLGRPFLYAMASYGQPGVEHAIRLLKEEMIRDMKLLGVNNIKELNEDMVDIQSLKYKGISSSDMLYTSNYTNMPAPLFRK